MFGNGIFRRYCRVSTMVAVSRISSIDCLTDESFEDVLIKIGVFNDVGLADSKTTRRCRSGVLILRAVERGRVTDIFSEFCSLY